jgi:peptide/nickel transport system permease protein
MTSADPMSQSRAPAPAPELRPEAEALGPAETPLEEAWRHFKRDRLAMTGLVVLAILVVVAVLGKVLTEAWVVLDPAAVRLPDKLLPPLAAPSALIPKDQLPELGRYLFGTDELGRSVFARMMQGSFVSLSIGVVAVAISVSIGILFGGLAGFYGDRKLGFISVDTLIMRFTDIVLCFPTFFLILTVVALLPPSIFNIMIVIGATSWMGTARFVRAEFLSLREQDFVVAAKALGLPERRIIFRHMVPNALAPVFVSATIDVAHAILTESALSFLGFGVRPPHATWGNILADGRMYIFDAPWLFVIPGVAILIVVLAFNLVGEGLREALNPRLRQRRA